MRLYELSEEAKAAGISDCEINKITDDTRSLVKGDIFVCIKGENFDGHSRAREMEKKGAALIAAEYDTGAERQIIVENSRKYYSELAGRYYGNPQKKLKMIAVTGTNGKSTTASMIQFILNEKGHKSGLIGTIGIDVCSKMYEARLTTPRQMDFYRYLAEMRDNGAEYCVMEASSLALVQNRFSDVEFECAVFTNLTQDHLDYHKTMENYYQAKRLLFNISKFAVICADDEYGRRLTGEINIPYVNYSTENIADYYAVNIKSKMSGISYWLSSREDEKSFPVRLKMIGEYNAANSMAAVAVCRRLGIRLDDCVDVMEKYSGCCGRSEIIWSGNFTVVCDYAHTEDALEKLLSSLRKISPARIICVFGAAGERDAGKRKAMGETVSRLCDYAVITSDNPRFEDQMAIIKQVEAGVKKNAVPYSIFQYRREAIEFALNEAENGDVVALCGKGHEKYQVIGDEYQFFDEHQIVKEIMEMKVKESN